MDTNGVTGTVYVPLALLHEVRDALGPGHVDVSDAALSIIVGDIATLWYERIVYGGDARTAA